MLLARLLLALAITVVPAWVWLERLVAKGLVNSLQVSVRADAEVAARGGPRWSPAEEVAQCRS